MSLAPTGIDYNIMMSLINPNHTGIDRDVWRILWVAFREKGYDPEEFIPLIQPLIKDKISDRVFKGIWKTIKNQGDVSHFLDSMSDNQVESKTWLINMVNAHTDDVEKIHVLGGWFAHPLLNMIEDKLPDVKLVENIDLDDNALKMCRFLNEGIERPFEVITTNEDVMTQGMRDWDIRLVINTSSEHMPPLPEILKHRKYRKIEDRTSQGPCLFAIQSNNMFHIPDHINCVNSEDELAKISDLKQVLYKGSMTMPNGYKRFMVIGYA